MEIDISEIIAEKKEKRRIELVQNEKDFESRRARRVAREAEAERLFESYFRRRAAAILDCMRGEHHPSKIEYWLLFDNWKVNDALLLLCGFDPRNWPVDADGCPAFPWCVDYSTREAREMQLAKRLDGLPIYSEIFEDVVGESTARRHRSSIQLEYGKIKALWDSGLHSEAQYPPQFFIDWASTKKREIPWLAWAQDRGLCSGGAVPEIARPAAVDKAIAPKAETCYLNIVGALAELYWAAAHNGEPYSQAALLRDLKQYEGYAGMGERNLKDKLSRAMKTIKE